MDKSKFKAFIIDDEGDQASLNTAKDKIKNASATYKEIVKMKDLLEEPMYLSVTATPQANIFLDDWSRLRPDSIRLIQPGIGYDGAAVYHLYENDIIDIVSDDDHEELAEGIIPESLWEAVRYFIVASAIKCKRATKTKEHYSDMIIHAFREVSQHSNIYTSICNYMMLVQAKAEGLFELFFLDLSTGLRRGELLGLQWDDVDFDKKELHIKRQVTRVEGKLTISKPKTKRSARPVPLSDITLYVLSEYKKSATSKWLFPSPVNPDNPREPAACRKRLSKILERAGCKHVRFHDLRHTFATMALENGIDIKTLADILGHTTVATTINTYTHSTAEMQAAAAKKIDHAIAGVNDTTEEVADTADTPSEEAPTFVPVEGKYRKRGTGYVKQLSENCWQGRYSPTVNGERVSHNVYGETEEECEVKLAEKIREVKAELWRA